MRKTFIILSVAFFILSCGNKNKNSAEQKQYEIKFPAVPSILVTPQERSEYLATHFWDNFDFTDTAYISLPDITEQAFADYLAPLGLSSPEVASASIKKMLERAESTPAMFEYFTDLYEKYLYTEGSPARNDELYIPVLEYVINSDKVDELNKLRPQSQLKLVMQNRVGHKANDFEFTTPDGKVKKLSDTESFFILLYIYNPGCSTCKEVTSSILNSQTLHTAIQFQMVKVVAIYPDKDLSLWREYLPEMPEKWIHGYDHKLALSGGLYDLKAIPSLYLLDSDLKVIIKDAPSIAPIVEYFRNK